MAFRIPAILRTRKPSEAVTGGLVRLEQEYGYGNPNLADLTPPLNVVPGLYHYHEGDLFDPGTGNYVFESPFELPVQTLWGNAFLRIANVFKPTQPPQVYARNTVTPAGIGGLQHGNVQHQPLLEFTKEQGWTQPGPETPLGL